MFNDTFHQFIFVPRSKFRYLFFEIEHMKHIKINIQRVDVGYASMQHPNTKITTKKTHITIQHRHLLTLTICVALNRP